MEETWKKPEGSLADREESSSTGDGTLMDGSKGRIISPDLAIFSLVPAAGCRTTDKFPILTLKLT
jgi:hypothetical protein